MKIALVDQSRFDYTPLTASTEPLGGMQSSLACLATELARRGHEVTVLNGTSRPGSYAGSTWLRLSDSLEHSVFGGFDVIVANQCPGVTLRRVAPRTPMLLWTGHNALEPSVQVLADAREARNWDAFVFNTRWQALGFVQRFGLPGSRCAFVNKAFSPAFLANSSRSEFFFDTGRPPVLYYSSTPFRGLDVLLAAFPRIRQAVPGAVLRVWSSMRPYQVTPEDDEFDKLYERCINTEGVEYGGSLSQPALASEVARADVLAFPSTYAETGCITLMEAMVSGCIPVFRDFGALCETSAGFGAHYLLDPGSSRGRHAAVFAQHTIRTLRDAVADPERTRLALRRQSAFAAGQMSWARRADKWERILMKVAEARRRRETTPVAPRQADGRDAGTDAGMDAGMDAGGQAAPPVPSDLRLPDWREDASPGLGRFQALVRRLMDGRGRLGVVQVGANDGRINDPLHDVVMSRPAATRMLLIEPQPELIGHLRENYRAHPDARCWCGAIGPPGTLTLYRVRSELWDRFVPTYLQDAPAYRVPSGFASSSIRHVLAHTAGRLPPGVSPKDAIEALRVPSTDLPTLLDERFPDFGDVHVVQVDAEGMDHVVIRHCAVARFRPLLVNFEHAHLDGDARRWLVDHFRGLGYRLVRSTASDTLAVRNDFPGLAGGP